MVKDQIAGGQNQADGSSPSSYTRFMASIRRILIGRLRSFLFCLVDIMAIMSACLVEHKGSIPLRGASFKSFCSLMGVRRGWNLTNKLFDDVVTNI